MDSAHSVSPNYASQLEAIVQERKGHADYQTTKKIKKVVDEVLVGVDNGSIKKAEVDEILKVFGSKEFQVLLEGPRYFKTIRAVFSAAVTRCFVDKVYKSSWEYAKDLRGTALPKLYKTNPDMANTVIVEVIARKHEEAILEAYAIAYKGTDSLSPFYFLFELMGLKEMSQENYQGEFSFSQWKLKNKDCFPKVFMEDLEEALKGLEMESKEITEAELEVEAKRDKTSWGYVKNLSTAKDVKVKQRDIVKEVALKYKKALIDASYKIADKISPQDFSVFLKEIETEEPWSDKLLERFGEIVEVLSRHLSDDIMDEINFVRDDDLVKMAEGLKFSREVLGLMDQIKTEHPVAYESFQKLLAINEDEPPTHAYQIRQKLNAFKEKLEELEKQGLPQGFIDAVRGLMTGHAALFTVKKNPLMERQEK